MNVDLGKLEEGNWRELTDSEMAIINKMVATSTKTEEASRDTQKKKFIPNRSRKFNPRKKR